MEQSKKGKCGKEKEEQVRGKKEWQQQISRGKGKRSKLERKKVAKQQVEEHGRQIEEKASWYLPRVRAPSLSQPPITSDFLL